LLHGIIDNLLSNALEYADRHQPIHCRISNESGLAAIAFTNHCTALKQSDIEVMCDTFWRKEAARSDSTHHGLGLTLVQTYARCMRLDFAISQLQSDEVTFTIKGLRISAGESSE
jgi:signal transduction histidine kinase